MCRAFALSVLGAALLAAGGWLLLGSGGSGGVRATGGRIERDAERAEPVLAGANRTRSQPNAMGRTQPEEEAPASSRGPTVAVAGRVVLAPGVRFDDLLVHVSDVGGRELEDVGPDEVLSDSGEFRFEGIPEGAHLRIEVRPVRPETRNFLQAWLLDVPAGREDLVIVLRPAGRIRGTVVEASGRARPHADVRAYEARGVAHDAFLAYAECDETGTFVFDRLPVGPVLLVANRKYGGGESAPLSVEAPAQDVRVALAAGRPISGRLFGDGDLTRFEVWVWRTDFAPHEAEREHPTVEGAFTVDGVGATGRWMVAARADGDDRCALAGPFEPGTTGARLKLEAVPVLEGTLVTADGGALPKDTRVYLRSAFLDDWTQVDAQGRWRFRGLLPGRYDLQIDSYEDRRYGRTGEKGVESTRSDVRLVLPLAGSDGGSSCGAGGKACR